MRSSRETAWYAVHEHLVVVGGAGCGKPGRGKWNFPASAGGNRDRLQLVCPLEGCSQCRRWLSQHGSIGQQQQPRRAGVWLACMRARPSQLTAMPLTADSLCLMTTEPRLLCLLRSPLHLARITRCNTARGTAQKVGHTLRHLVLLGARHSAVAESPVLQRSAAATPADISAVLGRGGSEQCKKA